MIILVPNRANRFGVKSQPQFIMRYKMDEIAITLIMKVTAAKEKSIINSNLFFLDSFVPAIEYNNRAMTPINNKLNTPNV